jgi:signal transduction histidine kinase/DNA-binding response OmpR family regulator
MSPSRRKLANSLPEALTSEVPPNGADRSVGPAPLDVLLVDDSDRNLLALEATLADLDARLVKARSGREALRRLLEQDFALILLDVRMPDMDGFETAEIVRSRDRSRHTPIILVTAFDRTREEEVRGYALGAVDFLTKPVVPEVLRGKVSVLIELHRKNEEVRRQASLLHEAEHREALRQHEEERRRWREEALRAEMERERQVAAALQRSNERLQLLSDTASELLLRDEPLAIVSRLFPRVAAHLAVEQSLAHLVQGDGVLALAWQAGIPAACAAEVARLAQGELVMGRAAAERRPVVIGEGGSCTDRTDRFLDATGVTACACLPLVSGERLHGVLTFATRARARFDPDDLAVMHVLADLFAAALERNRLLDDLRRSTAELREADARKDEFLAMLGHELRNPLAPVLNAVKLVRPHVPEEARMGRVLGAAERQIAHMTRLLDDLLDVSRIRNGKIALKRGACDLGHVIQDAVQETEALFEERGHVLILSLPPDPVAFQADAVRIGQVVANLLNNAAKYTDPGGHVALSAAQERGEVVIRVKDDGIGIAPAILPRVFDIFVQADVASDRARGGLGLGLTLVRTLVELHGGTVTARSDGHGKGSEFEVRLPATGGPDARGDAAGQGPRRANGSAATLRVGAEAPVHPRHVVLVEDNADIRESLRALLELKGYEVAEAKDGREGVGLILARRPEVALVDIGLPGVDGYEVARELRASPEHPPTRLVAMTGYGRPEDRQLALDAGFDAHLVKPVDFDDLTRLLDAL